MKRSRFSEEQIIGILKEHQAGMSAAELCRKHGTSDAIFYKWRSKYGGMEVSDARKLKGLEEENRRLKKLLAEQVLNSATLKEMLRKTFDAQLSEKRRDLGDHAARLFPALSLRPGGDGPQELPVRLAAAEQYGSASPSSELALE